MAAFGSTGEFATAEFPLTRDVVGISASAVSATAVGSGVMTTLSRYLADFASDAYSVGGETVSFSEAATVTRSTVTYARDLAGTVSQFAINVAARTDKGLLIQPAITRKNANPANLHSWAAIAGGTEVELSAEGVFTNPVTVGTSNGNAGSSRQDATFSGTSGSPISVRARYRAGTSGRAYVAASTVTGAVISGATGVAGSLVAQFQAFGNLTELENIDLGGGLYEVAYRFSPNVSVSDIRLRIGPNSTTIGQTVDFLGAQAVADTGLARVPEWVLSTSPQAADVVTLHLPEGEPLVIAITDDTGAVFYEHGVEGDYVIDPADLSGNYCVQAEASVFILINGDSYAGNTGYHVPWGSALDLNIAVGGSTLYEQITAWEAVPAYADYPTIWVDGGPGGYVDVATYTAAIASTIAAFGDTPVVFCLPFPRANLNSTVNGDMEDVREWMLANYPDNYVDWQDVPELTTGDGSFDDLADLAAGYVPRSIMPDGTHLEQEASTAYFNYARQRLLGFAPEEPEEPEETPLPEIVGINTHTGSGGAGSVTPDLPAGWAVDDLHLLSVNSLHSEPVATPTGWIALGTSVPTSGNRLSLFARTAEAGDTGPVIADPGDHVYTSIMTFRNPNGGPLAIETITEANAAQANAASTSVSWPSITTTGPNRVILHAMADNLDATGARFSGHTNAGLANLTEQRDLGITAGAGGGLVLVTGQKLTAGATGNTTGTVTSAIQALMTIAIYVPEDEEEEPTVSEIVGSSDAEASAVGVLQAVVSVAGTSSSSSVATATAHAIAAVTGTSAASADASAGIVTGEGMAGSAEAEFTALGVVESIAELVGIASSTLQASATGLGYADVIGTSSVSAVASGAAGAAADLAGVATALFDAAGVQQNAATFTGVAAASIASSGTAGALAAFAGSSAAITASGGAAASVANLAGASSVTTSAIGSSDDAVASFAGVASSGLQVFATAEAFADMTGTAAASFLADGAMSGIAHSVGVSLAEVEAYGSTQTAIDITGTASSAFSAAAALVAIASTAGLSASVSSALSEVWAIAHVVGTSTSEVFAESVTDGGINLSGYVSASFSVVGASSAIAHVAGTSSMSLQISASMEALSHVSGVAAQTSIAVGSLMSVIGVTGLSVNVTGALGVSRPVALYTGSSVTVSEASSTASLMAELIGLSSSTSIAVAVAEYEHNLVGVSVSEVTVNGITAGITEVGPHPDRIVYVENAPREVTVPQASREASVTGFSREVTVPSYGRLVVVPEIE